jgi:hypothetical protein
MRIACYIASVIFLLFTYWQINDTIQYGNHDNWFWLLLYGAVAVATFLHARRPLPRWSLSAGAGFALGSCLFRMQDPVGNFDWMTLFRATAIPSQMNATIQQPNESGGLLLVAIWMTILAWKSDAIASDSSGARHPDHDASR